MQSLRKEVELYDREGNIKNEIATIVLVAGATLGLGHKPRFHWPPAGGRDKGREGLSRKRGAVV